MFLDSFCLAKPMIRLVSDRSPGLSRSSVEELGCVDENPNQSRGSCPSENQPTGAVFGTPSIPSKTLKECSPPCCQIDDDTVEQPPQP